MINQKRRKLPVWQNTKRDMYIFASSDEKWVISNERNYNKDSTDTHALTGLRKGCPTNREFYIYLDDEWKWSTDFFVKVKGKVKN